MRMNVQEFTGCHQKPQMVGCFIEKLNMTKIKMKFLITRSRRHCFCTMMGTNIVSVKIQSFLAAQMSSGQKPNLPAVGLDSWTSSISCLTILYYPQIHFNTYLACKSIFLSAQGLKSSSVDLKIKLVSLNTISLSFVIRLRIDRKSF